MRLLRGLLLAASSGGPTLEAQQPVVVSGRVVRVTIEGERPVPATRVVLHRIGQGSAGPLDSVLTDAAGRYNFRVSRPDTAAMYLATSRFGGIAYFAPPVHPGDDGSRGEIQVFDTTSAPVRIRVGGRHLVVSAPDPDGNREVVDVYELQNDTVVTRVGTRTRPTFSAVLPPDAVNVRAAQGDFTGNAVVLGAARANVVAPIAPGVRQLAITYSLPSRAFPLTLELADSADVVEVLLEEAAGAVSADSVHALGAVSSEGRSFVRYLGRDIPAGRRVAIQVPVSGGARANWPWLVGMGAATLAAIAWALRPRRRGDATARTGPPLPAARVRELESAIAGVDALLAAPGTSPASIPSLEGYRDQLRRELDALSGAEEASGVTP